MLPPCPPPGVLTLFNLNSGENVLTVSAVDAVGLQSAPVNHSVVRSPWPLVEDLLC